MAFEVKMVEHKKIVDELIQLYNFVFEKSCTRAFWEWLFLESPISALEPNIIIAVEGGKIIGARPLVLRELWIKDKKVKAAQPAGTMVHPDHRRKGVFSKMNELAIEYFKEKGFALFFQFPQASLKSWILETRLETR
jgi:GNAT superfamily N-acetyltransferase